MKLWICRKTDYAINYCIRTLLQQQKSNKNNYKSIIIFKKRRARTKITGYEIYSEVNDVSRKVST